MAGMVDELIWDDRVDASKVSVEVSHGTVTLRGEVPTYLASSAASDDAVGILGVVDLRTQLAVHYPASVSIPTDEELETEIRRKLAWNPDIDVLDMEVGVSAGVVPSWPARESAHDAAAFTAGVTGVDDRLLVSGVGASV